MTPEAHPVIEGNATLLLVGFYLVAILIGFVISNAITAFYTTVFLSIGTCILLNQIGFVTELGGLAQILPFSIVPRIMVRKRMKPKRSSVVASASFSGAGESRG